jgi:hypothetical protein
LLVVSSRPLGSEPSAAIAVAPSQRIAMELPAEELFAQHHTRRYAMIHGAHVIIYSKDADADRAFFRDVLEYPFADAGHGWLIFALPPAEVAVHPAEKNDGHELYLMCDDVKAFVEKMKAKDIACSSVSEQRWGSLVHLTLPGGGKLGVYQPKHESPIRAR